MNIAFIIFKGVLLVVAALIAFGAAAALGGFDAPPLADSDCAAEKLRACFFAII